MIFLFALGLIEMAIAGSRPAGIEPATRSYNSGPQRGAHGILSRPQTPRPKNSMQIYARQQQQQVAPMFKPISGPSLAKKGLLSPPAPGGPGGPGIGGIGGIGGVGGVGGGGNGGAGGRPGQPGQPGQPGMPGMPGVQGPPPQPGQPGQPGVPGPQGPPPGWNPSRPPIPGGSRPGGGNPHPGVRPPSPGGGNRPGWPGGSGGVPVPQELGGDDWATQMITAIVTGLTYMKRISDDLQRQQNPNQIILTYHLDQPQVYELLYSMCQFTYLEQLDYVSHTCEFLSEHQNMLNPYQHTASATANGLKNALNSLKTLAEDFNAGQTVKKIDNNRKQSLSIFCKVDQLKSINFVGRACGMLQRH